MIGLLQSYHASEILLALAGILVLIDYFYPTDWPAHLGYFCVGAAVFFAVFRTGPDVVWDLSKSLTFGVAIWILLEFLHRLVFWRLLTNEPNADEQAATE